MVEANKIQLFMGALMRPLRTSNSRLRSDSGQAVVEYILVLVVTIGILLGVMYQFSTAFKKYVQSYFGEYVACLLETGELPTLGGTDGANAGICAASFEPFSLKNGRPMIGSGGNGDGSDSDGSSGRGARNRSASRRGNGLNSSKVTRGMTGRNGEAVSSESTNGGAADDGKKRIVKRYVSNPSFSFQRKGRQEDGQIRLSDNFKMASEEKEKKPFAARIDTAGAKGGIRLRGKKLHIDINKFNTRKPAGTDVGLDLSLGDYVRYLIILGIVVMIILFFGGQLMQIKKNYEAS